jgi:tetratricopeptide (TPR) repeat protein
LAVVVSAANSTRAVDTVVYRTGEDGSGRATASGTVVDYVGGNLVLLRESGARQSIPSSRVVQLETEWTAMHEAGERLFEAGEFEEAARSYRSAISTESRRWAKRRIVASLVQSYKNMGQFERAGDAFIELVRSDPATHYFHLIPLSWKSHQPTPGFQTKAEAWLRAETSSVRRLLGASWLLSTGQRGDSIDALQGLASDTDLRVAFLSQAQLWRTRVVTAKLPDVENWDATVGRMPNDLRAGPYYVLGRAWGAQGEHRRAALSFLRVPIQYPAERRLAAWALLSAGRELERIDQTREALSLYQEVVRDHGGHPAEAEAQALLDRPSGS